MTREEILKEVASFIASKKNERFQIGDVYQHILEVLIAKGEIKKNLDPMNFGIAYQPPRLPESYWSITNEIIWNLILDRAITPGGNRDNPDLPWLRITNESKLKELIG